MGDGANPMIPDADHMRIYQCVIPYFEMTRMHAGFCQVTTAEHAICRVWEKRNDGGKGRLVFEKTVYSEDVKRITSTVFEAYRKIGRNKYVSCVQYHSLQFKWLWEWGHMWIWSAIDGAKKTHAMMQLIAFPFVHPGSVHACKDCKWAVPVHILMTYLVHLFFSIVSASVATV